MGYGDDGIVEKRPAIDKDLLFELPSHGSSFNTIKNGLIRVVAKLKPSLFSGGIRSDDSIDRDMVDDLSDLVEYMYDNRATVLPDLLLNDINLLKDIVINVDSTSASSKEWTVTTGKIWVVLACCFANDTDTGAFDITITPSGGTAGIIAGVTGATATRTYNMLTGGGGIYGVCYPLILDSADKIKIEDVTFTAGDTVRKTIVYVELTP